MCIARYKHTQCIYVYIYMVIKKYINSLRQCLYMIFEQSLPNHHTTQRIILIFPRCLKIISILFFLIKVLPNKCKHLFMKYYW